MKLKLLSLLLPLSLISSLCAQSQSEMNEIAAKEFAAADAKLNKLYKKLMVEGDDESDKRLKEAQRAWLKYVDLHIKYLFPLKEGQNPREIYGSAYPMDYALEKTELFLRRIVQLGGKI